MTQTPPEQSTTTSDAKNGVWQYSTTTTNGYAWWDGAVQASTSFARTDQPTYATSYSYGPSGQLTQVQVNDGRPRTIRLTSDMNGQALRRDETDTNSGAGDPHEVWYYFNGRQMASTGNNGSLRTDYATSIDDRVRVRVPGTGAFRFGSSEPDDAADPMMSLDPITSYDQGSSFGSYTVQGGDTLPGIAAALWGDASLWYKLAEANGLDGAGILVPGQRLTVPAGVMRSRHAADTFRPYDPVETLGDTGPTNPKQPKKQNGCGILGAILLTVVAVAVAVATAGAAVAALSPSIGTLGAGIGAVAAGTTGLGAGTMIGIGAASGALGSIASQAFGVATGLQDGFSWTGVALAGISGAVGGGMGAAFRGGMLGSQFLGDVARGAVSNGLVQGIGIATGLRRQGVRLPQWKPLPRRHRVKRLSVIKTEGCRP